MATSNAFRSKVQSTREELQKQIQDKRAEREMMRQAQLDQEKFEGQMNQAELKRYQELQDKLRSEKKSFAQESLQLGMEKREKEKQTEEIYKKQEASV